MKEVLQKTFLALVIIPLLLAGCAMQSTNSSTNPASVMQVRPLSQGINKDLYQVTCDNGKQHTFIADLAEQNFQYYYPNKGYYIKYYDMEF